MSMKCSYQMTGIRNLGKKQNVALCQEYRVRFNRTLLNKVENYLKVAHDIAECISLTLLHVLRNDTK